MVLLLLRQVVWHATDEARLTEADKGTIRPQTSGHSYFIYFVVLESSGVAVDPRSCTPSLSLLVDTVLSP